MKTTRTGMLLAACGALLLALGLLACGHDEPVAGGGGIWDETGNTVALQVTDRQGVAARTKVRWVSLSQWYSAKESGTRVAYDSAMTDAKGRATIAAPAGGETWALWTGSGQTGSYRVVSGHAASLKVQEDTVGGFSGHLQNGAAWPDSVVLAGTDYVVAVGDDGSFHFDNVAPGKHTVLAQSGSKFAVLSTVSLSAGAVTENTNLPWSPDDGLLMDDFDDAMPANSFHALTGEGWWYLAGDSASRFEPSDIALAVVAGDSAYEGGRSLHLRIAAGSDPALKYALCGFDIDMGAVKDTTLQRVQHDLTSLDSVVFMARGSGQVRLQIAGVPGTIPVLSLPIDLTDAWTRYTVVPADFKVDDWQLLAGQASAVNFYVADSADLWLDDIWLYGLDGASLFGLR